jgi:hypothetical protein
MRKFKFTEEPGKEYKSKDLLKALGLESMKELKRGGLVCKMQSGRKFMVKLEGEKEIETMIVEPKADETWAYKFTWQQAQDYKLYRILAHIELAEGDRRN